MRFEAAQHLRMSQQMKLAPRMIQSMEILQLSMQELEERLEQALESNVALEIDDPAADDRAIAEERKEQERIDHEGERELFTDVENNSEGDFERLATMESALGEELNPEHRIPQPEYRRGRVGDEDPKMEAMANAAARTESVNEQLLQQWALAEVDDSIRRVGEHLINFIDDDGFIRTSLEEIADQASAKVDRELIEEGLEALQVWLEPTGIAARNLGECLQIQLEAKESEDPSLDFSVEKMLLSDFLEDIEQNRLPALARKSGLTIEEIQRAKETLKGLNPAPGRQLASSSPHFVIPDALVEYDDALDNYVVSLFDGQLPRIRISARYEAMTKDGEVDKKTRDFVNENIRDARWLLDAIHQRQNTLLRVVNAVVAHQRDFLDQGPQALKPLPMSQIADQLGIHVATVSRAVSGKWIQTPRGVLPLRKLFTAGLETEGGQDVSGDSIKATLKNIIDHEDKHNPLGDDQLTNALKEKGIKIARRTVAKYRTHLGFPNARLRKEF